MLTAKTSLCPHCNAVGLLVPLAEDVDYYRCHSCAQVWTVPKDKAEPSATVMVDVETKSRSYGELNGPARAPEDPFGLFDRPQRRQAQRGELSPRRSTRPQPWSAHCSAYATGPMSWGRTKLEVQVREPATTHTVTVQQIQRQWGHGDRAVEDVHLNVQLQKPAILGRRAPRLVGDVLQTPSRATTAMLTACTAAW